MKPLRAFIALGVLLWGASARATVYAPPESIPLPFGPGGAELHESVRSAVDRLAIRALRCGGDGGITVTLKYMPMADRALLQRRVAAVRGRFQELGVPAALSTKLFRAETDGTDEGDARLALPPPWFAAAGVHVGEDEDLCWDGETPSWWAAHPILEQWRRQLTVSLSVSPPQLPLFWQQLTPSVRRDHLSLALAQMSYEAAQKGSTPSLRAYWWLVQNEARLLPPERRVLWVLHLWTRGTDADLSELQRQLGIGEIPLEARADHAPYLAFAQLPEDVIERRLLEPGLIQRAAERLGPALGDVSRLSLLSAAIERRTWASWARLMRAAGPARACFVADAMWVLRTDKPEHRQAFSQLSTWAGGVSPAFGAIEPNAARGLSARCDPTTAWLVIGTDCGRGSPNPGLAAKFVDAGFIPDPARVAQALSPEGLSDDCRLERAPGRPFPYRHRTR